MARAVLAGLRREDVHDETDTVHLGEDHVLGLGVRRLGRSGGGRFGRSLCAGKKCEQRGHAQQGGNDPTTVHDETSHEIAEIVPLSAVDPQGQRFRPPGGLISGSAVCYSPASANAASVASQADPRQPVALRGLNDCLPRPRTTTE